MESLEVLTKSVYYCNMVNSEEEGLSPASLPSQAVVFMCFHLVSIKRCRRAAGPCVYKAVRAAAAVAHILTH